MPNILVIGDVILDEYVYVDTIKISAEAPIPVVKINKKEYRLGGAANVANNIKSLRGKVTLIGTIGKDKEGRIIKKELRKNKIKHEFIEKNETIIKSRIINNEHQMIRIDKEQEYDEYNSKIDYKKFDVIIISDYNKGTINKKIIDKIKKSGKKIIVDTKPSKMKLYKNVYLIKINEEEARKTTNDYKSNIEKIGNKIKKDYNCNLIITRGSKGMMLFEKNKPKFEIKSEKVEVSDVSGAGDTVIASLAVNIRLFLRDNMRIANKLAGIVVGKFGTSTVDIRDLGLSKIITHNELKHFKNNIVFTNGCFDIIHPGHIKLLKTAKKQGKTLIVGINTDETIKKIKGKNRPILNLTERITVMSAIKYVDHIIVFKEKNSSKIIKMLKPSVYVKGGDYNPLDYKKLPEAKIVNDYKGKIIIVPHDNKTSTTKIITKIYKHIKTI